MDAYQDMRTSLGLQEFDEVGHLLRSFRLCGLCEACSEASRKMGRGKYLVLSIALPVALETVNACAGG